jgi:hypothetical protein
MLPPCPFSPDFCRALDLGDYWTVIDSAARKELSQEQAQLMSIAILTQPVLNVTRRCNSKPCSTLHHATEGGRRSKMIDLE